MKIEQWHIEDIIPYENNPRINDHAVDKTAMSIEQYGWQQPIVVDADGVIIAGHTRLKAAVKLGITKCPVVVAGKLNPVQVKAYRIADNKSGELAEWDEELLNIEIKDLIDAGYEISFTGFEIEPESGSGEPEHEQPEKHKKKIECPGCGARWEK